MSLLQLNVVSSFYNHFTKYLVRTGTGTDHGGTRIGRCFLFAPVKLFWIIFRWSSSFFPNSFHPKAKLIPKLQSTVCEKQGTSVKVWSVSKVDHSKVNIFRKSISSQIRSLSPKQCWCLKIHFGKYCLFFLTIIKSRLEIQLLV